MAAMGVAVNFYWNGIVKNEQNDVAYKGAKVNVLPIKVFHGTTNAGLSDKIYATTDIDSVTPQNPGVLLTTVNLRKPVCLIS